MARLSGWTVTPERCYCGADDCYRCHPENMPPKRDPDDWADEQHDRDRDASDDYEGED